MNATPVKTALRFLAAWATVVLFAVLLTLVFSFLGAFFCAALAGMMFGSVRLPLWQASTFSLTFPAVLVGIVRSGGAELLAGQILVLSLVCFGTFWLTYALVCLVIWYERKDPKLAAGTIGAVAAESNSLLARRLQEPGSTSGTVSGSARFWRELTLQLLQGKWSCVTTGADSRREHKIMKIEQQQLVLTVSDSDGKVHSMSQAEVKLGGAAGLVTLSPFFDQPCDDTLVCI